MALTQVPGPPRFGRQAVRVLAGGDVEVLSTSETVLAKQSEDREQFVARLLRDFGVGPSDGLMIVYKAGKPQYAIVEWGTGDLEAQRR